MADYPLLKPRRVRKSSLELGRNLFMHYSYAGSCVDSHLHAHNKYVERLEDAKTPESQ